MSATQVEVPITARSLFVSNKEDKQTQTEGMHSRCTHVQFLLELECAYSTRFELPFFERKSSNGSCAVGGL